MRKKLVVFDLDGTLIRSLAPGGGLRRFPYALKKIFGRDIPVSLDMWKRYDGWGDRAVLWDLLGGRGISMAEFTQKMPQVGQTFAEFLQTQAAESPLYEAIPEARAFFDRVVASPHTEAAILTGNLEESALWKMRHTGFSETIAFGVYGQEAHDRVGLAKLVIPKAKEKLGVAFSPREIFFVGDTIYDIRAGKAIGAVTVAVATGHFTEKERILKEKPDVFVESLADPTLTNLLGIRVDFKKKSR